MARRKRRSIRDPLHGFVELSTQEWAIVNHPVFQRLRDIRQLGMGHMVYPGANHTRFEHSLGVVHVSDRIFDRLKQTTDPTLWQECFGDSGTSERMRRTLRLASLLHDVGHGPFSHAGEHFFIPPEFDVEKFPDNDVQRLKKQYNHESMTVRLVRETELAKLIEDCDVDVEEVIAVATDRALAKFQDYRLGVELLNQLLTAELGSDRCDYLLRDAYHSGQPGGHFDLDRLVQQMAIIEKDGALYLGIRLGGWIAAEQMIANRYAAYVNLYFHKAKRSYETHLARFLEAWLPSGRLPQDVSQFGHLTDSSVISGMKAAARNESEPGHSDALAFERREHFRSVFEKFATHRRSKRDEHGSRAIPPDAIEEFADSVRKEFVSRGFVDIMEHSATKIRRPEPLDRILVDVDGDPRYLDELSEIVRGMDDKIWRLRVHAEKAKQQEVKRFCARRWDELSMKHGVET